jgi:hypothetical protein
MALCMSDHIGLISSSTSLMLMLYDGPTHYGSQTKKVRFLARI